MSKAFLLFLYGISVYITLDAWYKNGNSGMPDPAVIAPATWLFAILALASDFLEGLPIILGAASTVILYERSHPNRPANTNVPAKRNLQIGSTKK